MSTQGVNCVFQTRSGRALTLSDQATDGTELEVKSGGNAVNVTDDVSLGQYGAGETITHGLCVGSVAILYAYVLGQNGKIIMPVPVANDVSAQGIVELCRPLRLETGMQLRVMTTDAGGTQGVNASVGFYCSDGSVEYLTAIAANGTTVNFTSVQTGQSIGQTLAGKSVMKLYSATPLQLVLAAGAGSGQSGFPILSSEGYCKTMVIASNVLYGQPPAQFPPRLTITQNDTMTVSFDSS